MAAFVGDANIAGIYRRRQIPLVIIQANLSNTTQWFSSSTDSVRSKSSKENAYELLGVSETSSFAEIKSSFHKLAKETHPDLSESKNDSDASQRFVQILAAYEILSDSEKRTQYDMYLLSQRKLMQKQSGQGATLYTYKTHVATYKQMEVVEWLKWYRYAINDILSEKRVVLGNGYFDVLERDFYSAIHAAFYGPAIESMDFLPERFEAEERSVHETPELDSSTSGNKDVSFYVNSTSENKDVSFYMNSMDDFKSSQVKACNVKEHVSDAYKDLELLVSGRVVATATRVPPKGCCEGNHRMQSEDSHDDQIHVFLNSCHYVTHISKGFHNNSLGDDAVGSKIPLGTISGLGTSPEEGSCFVYNSSGTKTHVIMKHRTLMVKHMHWYGLGDEVSVCECRCSRARLPPSKFWLFEPRCGMHDIGGWYIETFGRDRKGWTVLSQRYWDGLDASEHLDKRLHPAMYLLTLAYRTLDLEDAKRRKWYARVAVEQHLSRILSWCKKLV
ncbi:hypothetical protein FNV43_RR19141 [Rhamnella rubrinervis]|uniref:J domain-containing protein n=1 Tax=Rhamnella rubrinervis TaxID=2594499 RepID=A0A8K0E0M0_9ROSA|nr:hypothetical protein FNV43_RR19141 [Rhamnella rubrinervis]